MLSFKASLQGQLILDSGKLIGSYFDRSVILICRHDASGCFGLVLSRPMSRTLGSVVSVPLKEPLSSIPMHQGGPVQPEAISFLHERGLPDGEVIPGVSLSHSLEPLKESWIFEESSRIHAYVGYAGWTGGQLEKEMKTHCWLTHKASPDLIFHPNPRQLWYQILKEKGGLFELMSKSPDNPALN